MPSSFAWVDFSGADPWRMQEVLDLPGEHDTRDEMDLGVVVRDAPADMRCHVPMFPLSREEGQYEGPEVQQGAVSARFRSAAAGVPASVRIPAKPIGHSGRCRSPVPARRSPGA